VSGSADHASESTSGRDSALFAEIESTIQTSAAGVVDEASARRLAELTRERLAFMVDPDLESWRTLAVAQGGDPAIRDGIDEELFVKRWTTLADRYAGTKLGMEGISVQAAELGQEHTLGGPGTSFLRGDSTLSAKYPDPPENARLVDVLVPAQYRLVNSGERIPCTLAFRYADHGPGRGWLLAEVFTYFGTEGFGHGLYQALY
jgi:hypothetical protein